MARLRSARLTNETLVSQIDDFVGELERDLATIFGFTLDSNITASPFSIDNSGRLTKGLVTWRVDADLEGVGPSGDPGNAALFIHNTTNSVEAVLGLGDALRTTDSTHLPTVGFSATGSAQFTPGSSYPGFALIMGATGDLAPYFEIIGKRFGQSQMGLCPIPSGNAGEYLNSDGTFRNVGRPSSTVLLTNPSDGSSINTNFHANASEVLFWTSEIFDTDGLHAANDDETIIAVAGKYLFGAQINFLPDDLDAGSITVKLMRDRAAADTQWGEMTLKFDTAVSPAGINTIAVDSIIDCNVGDKLWCQVIYTDDTGQTPFYTLPAGIEDNHFYVARIV